MRYIIQHIKDITADYNGSIPLAHYLKNYFRLHPKLGSRDRKTLSEMAYCWYRCEKGLQQIPDFEERLKAALLLCSNNEKLVKPFLSAEDWPLLAQKEQQRLSSLATRFHFDIDQLFPFPISLSPGIDRADWISSMLVQPDLFIRIRKNKAGILHTLRQQNIPFAEITDTCLALPNGAPIDKLLQEDTYVVQDASSQHTGSFFHANNKQAWYDCCCGAGGKSLLLKDKEPSVKLTVSDKRESILHNLRDRFRQYGHAQPEAICVDVADSRALTNALGQRTFDNIIADVPCTGSGTWARTPEQLYFFDEEQLHRISTLQKNIVVNASTHLKESGQLIYITCSVFSRENEEVVEHIKNETGLHTVEMQLINGLGIKADSMFIAILQKATASAV